jgi:molybdate transport system permease protein
MNNLSDPSACPANSNKSPRLRLRSWQVLSLPMMLFIALPLIGILLRASPTNILQALRQPQVLQAITLSLFTSLVTTFLAVLLGTPVAYALVHRRFRFFRLIDTLIDLPTVLPPAVAGVALLMTFGRRGLLGGFLSSMGISLPFTTAAVIMAQLFIAAPLYIKAAALGFSSVDCEIKQAAALDGASHMQVFRYMMVPLAKMAILSGCVMTWARSLGEFGATLIFAGNYPGRTQTMPLAIYLGFEIDMDVAMTLALILILISFASLVTVKGILHHQTGPVPQEDIY